MTTTRHGYFVFALLGLACHQGNSAPEAPSETPPSEPAVDACATVRCAAGTHCELTSEQTAICAADEMAPASCAVVLCAQGTYCDDLDGSAQCIPLPTCDGSECAEGQHCELVQVQCVRAPCPPQPSCVPNKT